MFTIEDTTRSLTVHLPDRGHAIASPGIWHRTGLSFDDARSHVERLNRIAVEVMNADAEAIYDLYHKAHFAPADYAQFVAEQAKHCRCESGNCPCDGVLAGGPCDEMPAERSGGGVSSSGYDHACGYHD